MTCTGTETTRADELKALWRRERESLTREQGDKIGLAYITKALGLSEEVAERFSLGDSSAHHDVGLRQGGIGRESDFRAFWKEVSAVAPSMCPEEDIEFLSERGDGDMWSVCFLLFTIEEFTLSKIISDLRTNAVAWE